MGCIYLETTCSLDYLPTLIFFVFKPSLERMDFWMCDLSIYLSAVKLQNPSFIYTLIDKQILESSRQRDIERSRQTLIEADRCVIQN